MRQHLLYKLDYGFKWNTRDYVQMRRKVKDCVSISFGKGQVPKSNWLWFLKRKMAELIHGNIWLDKILSEMQRPSVCFGREDEALQTEGLTAGLSGFWMWPQAIVKSSCMWYEQEIGTDKTVLQILYTDFFFPFMQLFFFLKKSSTCKAKKRTIHFKKY